LLIFEFDNKQINTIGQEVPADEDNISKFQSASQRSWVRIRDSKLQDKIKEGFNWFVKFIEQAHNSADLFKLEYSPIEESKNFIRIVILTAKFLESKHDNDECISIHSEKARKDDLAENTNDNEIYQNNNYVAQNNNASISPNDTYSNESVAYAKQLAKEYLKTRLNHEETSESVSLVHSYTPSDLLNAKDSRYITNQSIHVRWANYIWWVKKAMFYQQLESKLACKKK